MEKEKRMERMPPRVKQTVDSVYEYLIPHPDGISMSAEKTFGRNNARIITSLVSRRIIEKQRVDGQREYKYKWTATMGPTPTLYRSIALEIQTENQRYQENHKNKKIALPKVEKAPEVLPSTSVVNEPVAPVETKSAADQVLEMWTRMKEMGVSIENNQLVLTEVKVTKTVLA